MINGGPSIAVIPTLDGSPIMFWYIEKNKHVVFDVFKMLCGFILLWNDILLSSFSSILTLLIRSLCMSHMIQKANLF